MNVMSGCFEVIKQEGGDPGCSHAHILVDCPECGIGRMWGGTLATLPYRGAVDLRCDACSFLLRVYVDTDIGEIRLLGPRVCVSERC